MMLAKTDARVRYGSLMALAALVAAVLPSSMFVPIARAGSIIYVTTTAQDGTGGCSLGEAILSANLDVAVDPECVGGSGDDTIALLPGGLVGQVFPMSGVVYDEQNYIGPTATPIVTSTILIEGLGARLEHVPNGVNFRAFAVSDTGNLTIRDMHIKGFAVKGGNGTRGGGGGLGAGGAVYVHGGSLTVEQSTFEGNVAIGGNGGEERDEPSAEGFDVGGGGGGLGGNGGAVGVGGGGGGGARGTGGSGNLIMCPGGFFDCAFGFGGGGGGTVGPGFDGTAGSAVGGFECGGDGAGTQAGDSGLDAPCRGGGGGGGNSQVIDFDESGVVIVGSNGGGDGGDGSYGGGGGGGGWGSTLTESGTDGGHGGFGGGGGGAGNDGSGGAGGFGAGGGAGPGGLIFGGPGEGGTFGGDADEIYGGAGAGLGGAIFGHSANITIKNSTFTGNAVAHGLSNAALGPAQDAGGAVFLVAGSLTVLNSTISGNESTGAGAGIVVYKPTTGEATSLTLRNTIIANNGARECFFLGSVASVGSGNLIVQNFGCPGMAQTADPQLGPLLLNPPGRTPTMEIPITSPAVDTADPATALQTDQRGVLRPLNNGFDIGAFEAPPPDVDPPVLTIVIDAADTLAGTGWYNLASSGNDGVLVNVTASDATAVTNLTCADGATEVLNVAIASGSFTLGDGLHSIACVASDGINPAGAADGSTLMPVVIKVDQTAPTLNPVVTPNPVELGGSASVAANAADTTSGLASSSCGALDTQTPGVKSVACQAADNAGNTNTASVEYTVGYRFFGFQQPIPQTTYKRGSTIPVKFMLGYASGAHLSDAEAQALISPTCLVKVTLDGIVQPGCATYNAKTDTFQYDLKTAKSISPGNHTIGIQVSAPDNGGIVNNNSTTVVIRQ